MYVLSIVMLVIGVLVAPNLTSFVGEPREALALLSCFCLLAAKFT